MPHAIEGYGWFDRWRRDDQPSHRQLAVMREWLSRLVDNPRQEPSFASTRAHPHAQDDLRGAYLFDADAWIVYTVDQDDNVRLIYVAHEPPEGMDFGLS